MSTLVARDTVRTGRGGRRIDPRPMSNMLQPADRNRTTVYGSGTGHLKGECPEDDLRWRVAGTQGGTGETRALLYIRGAGRNLR